MSKNVRYALLSFGMLTLCLSFWHSTNRGKSDEFGSSSLVTQNSAIESIPKPASEPKPVKKTKENPPSNKAKVNPDFDKVMPDYFQKPLKIGIIITVNGLGKIDEKTSTFESDFDLRMDWYDPHLAFEPKKMGTNRLEYSGKDAVKKLATIWNPDISLTNMEGRPISEEIGLFIKEDGNVQYIRRVRAKFKTNYYLRSFPFDTEYLALKLLSTKYSKSEIEFNQGEAEINRSKVDENIKVIGWKINGLVFQKTTTRGWDGNFYPSLTANISITRISIGHLVVLTPLILIMLMPTFLTLYMQVEMARRLEAWAGAMLALVATSFTLNLRYPTLEPDSIINQLLTLCFGYQFFMIMITISIFNPSLIKNPEKNFLLQEVIRFLRWSIPSGLIILFVVRVLLIALS